MEKNKQLRVFAEEIRVETLKEFDHLGFGHVGGSMSIVETLAVLYGKEMTYDPKNPTLENRDRLVVSKGHAGPALYATLALKGFFPLERLLTLNQGGTTLPSHCDRTKTPGVDMTTGSLGQGSSMALGLALGAKMRKKNYTTYLILGDGECDEGQVWEAAMSAAHLKLDNLVTFVDWNKQQLDGSCDDVLYLGDMVEKFAAFGWHVQKVNGHDVDALAEAIENAKAAKGKPSVIILDTIKGNGCKMALETFPCHHLKFKKGDMLPSIEAAEQALSAARNA
ncbi:transketolase [Acidaminobacterium chupaoyuni]